MPLSLDSDTITHGIPLVVAQVFLMTAVSGMIGPVVGRLTETVIAKRLLNFHMPER